MSAVSLLFILLLCPRMLASNGRLLEAHASGRKSPRSLSKVLEKVKLMRIHIATYKKGVTKVNEEHRETSSAKDIVTVEVLNHMATEVKHEKRTVSGTIPTTLGHRFSTSPGLFSDYSRPKMRPPSHN